MENNDNELNYRYSNSLDTYSLLETDGSIDQDTADLRFQDLLRQLDNDTERFICIAIEFGYRLNEIAWIKSAHPSTITRMKKRILSKMRNKLQLKQVNKG